MSVLPLFYPRKAKNAVTCSVTTFREILKVVPPALGAIIAASRINLISLSGTRISVLNFLTLLLNRIESLQSINEN